MALLEVLRELSRAKRLTIRVAHIHHMIRAADADADLQFVRRYCGFLGIPFSSRRVDVPGRRARRGGSIEDAARTLRYGALEQMRAEQRMDIIATAHHADDQTETMLMRVARGTGVRGLAGILPRLAVPPVIRPLLRVTRAEIMAYLDDRRAPYRIDRTNEDIRLTRNAVRRVIIPRLLRSGERRLVTALPDLADVVRRFGIHVQRMVPLLPGQAPSRHGFVLVRISDLMALPPEVRRSYVGLLLSERGTELTRERIERALGLVTLPPGKRILFRTSDVQVFRDREHLAFGPMLVRSRTPVRLRHGGSASISGGIVRMARPSAPPARYNDGPNEAWVDAAKVRGTTLVRAWKAGDRMAPLGMRGRSKKVSDVLLDSRIPLYYKESVPVVTSGGRIVWVCGVRLDDRFKITPGTSRAIQLSYIPPA